MCTSCISCLFSICVALLVFNSCGLKASSEKETMTLHVCVVCVLMISFWCIFHQGVLQYTLISPSLALA